MRKAPSFFIFLIAVFSALNLYAQVAEKKPDTVFQKVAAYSKDGYKEDVKPIKKMTMFQFAADWVNGSSKDEKPSGSETPSLFWK